MDKLYTGYKVLKGNTDYINTCMNDKSYIDSFLCNEYLIIINTDTGNESEMRFDGEKFVNLKLPPSRVIKGKNALQRCALDLLNNKDITIVTILGTYGSGKAIINNANIPTPVGMKKLGDIKVGDKVFDRLGNETDVIGVFPQGELDCYEVEFSDGRKVYCNDEHLWTYITSKGNFKTVPLKEMINKGVRVDSGGHRYYIPLCSPVKFTEKNLSLHPYIMGYILGNGCLSEKAFTISSIDSDVIDKIKSLLNAKGIYHTEDNYSYSFYMQNKTGQISKFQTKEVLKDFPTLVTKAGHKYIPDVYKYGSIEQRLELLRGLLDSDGSIDGKGRVSFCSTSKQLIEDVMDLCYSLGFTAKERKEDYRDKYTNGVCYSIQITCSPKDKVNIFYCDRKKKKALEYLNNSKSTLYTRNRDCISIRNIKKIGKSEMTCILVDNPEHLFLANDYIVTHNTYLTSKMALYSVLDRGWQSKVFGIREPVGEGSPCGYLPGELDNKIADFLKPITQYVEKEYFDVENLKQRGVFDGNIPYYLKGVDLDHCVVLCEEAEDFSEKQIRLIGTRLSEGSRIFLSGDYAQSVFNSSLSNPLVKMCDELKGNPLFGCIALQDDVRSETSRLFANLFR